MQEPQASGVGAFARNRALDRCHEADQDSFGDAESSRDMHIELRAEGISEHDCSQLEQLDNQEHIIRKHPS